MYKLLKSLFLGLICIVICIVSGCLRTAKDLDKSSTQSGSSSDEKESNQADLNRILSTERTEFEIETGEILELNFAYSTVDVFGKTKALNHHLIELALQLDDSIEGVQQSSLASEIVRTDHEGKGKVTLIAGEIVETIYLRAYDPENPQVTPISWTISVIKGAINTQSLKISINYSEESGHYQIDDLHIGQVMGFVDIPCDDLSIQSSLDPLYIFPEIRPYNAQNSQVIGEISSTDLERLSIRATLMNDDYIPLASGCIDHLDLTQNDLIIEVKDLPEQFRTEYTAVHQFNLFEVAELQTSLSSLKLILKLIRIMSGSTEFMIEAERIRLCELIEPTLDGDTAYCSLIMQSSLEILTDLGNRRISSYAQYALMMLGELFEVINQLKWKSEIILLTQPREEVLTDAEHRWSRVYFDWNSHCLMNGLCADELTFTELNLNSVNAQLEINLQSTEARGQLEKILKIAPHHIEIEFGTIILNIIKLWLLPVSFNYSQFPLSLEDLFAESMMDACQVVDVELLADSVCIEIFGSKLGKVLTQEILALNQLKNFSLSGTIISSNPDQTPEIENLIQGQWLGNHQNFEFRGCFNACANSQCVHQPCE